MIQREDSINKLEQSKTSLREGETLKPRVAETEETTLDKSWSKLKVEKLNQRSMRAETRMTKLDKERAETEDKSRTKENRN